MGADLKRKEARKRRFGGQNYLSLPDAGVQLDLENTSPNHTPQDMSEQALPPPVASKNLITAVKSVDAGREAVATQKAQRFIVFIGNLPFTATDESISRHFANINPKSIRHQKEKDTGRSKGFAFLEFEGFDRMKTCLRLYHQSTFEDEGSPARRLNVELTAGGGGSKSKDRKSKLRVKNQRLNEQRKRRIQGDEKQMMLFTNDFEPTHAPDKNGSIHPSRRSRLITDRYTSYA